jgi:hypothetical protein
MKHPLKAFGFGLLTWIIPFIVAIPLMSPNGDYLIPETFFKTIMILVSAVTGVFLAVKYFKNVKDDYVKEAMMLSVLWLAINWGLDLMMVFTGLFKMSVWQYFTDIGFRYFNIPIFLLGMTWLLDTKNRTK